MKNSPAPALVSTFLVCTAFLFQSGAGGAEKPADTSPPAVRPPNAPATPGMVGFILDQQGGVLVVKGLIPASPAAAKHEILPGDRLVSIAPANGPAVLVRGKRLEEVTKLIRGPEGSTVRISAAHPGEDDNKAKTILLVRAPAEQFDSSLQPGELAPELAGVTWIKGQPVTKFAHDKVYLVACWATWCRPCVANIPRLEALHRKFQDRGLIVIGQNIWEEDSAKVRQFVAKMGDKMSYHVALDDYSGAHQGTDSNIGMPKGAMSESWIQPKKAEAAAFLRRFWLARTAKSPGVVTLPS